jgi:hypothetical protein
VRAQFEERLESKDKEIAVLLPLSLKREYQNGGGTASWSFPAIR